MNKIYYFKDCCSGKAIYAFPSFEAAYEGAKKATTGDQNRIKREINIAEIDNCNGFMIWNI